MHQSPYRLITFHQTGLYFDAATSRIRHGARESIPKNLVLEIEGRRGRLFVLGSQLAELCHIASFIDRTIAVLAVGRGSACVTADDLARDLVSLAYDGQFLSCDPEGNASFDRTLCQGWESIYVQAIDGFMHPDSDQVIGRVDTSTHDIVIRSGERLSTVCRQPKLVFGEKAFMICGPFNASWSLAAVNRRLALDIEEAHPGQCRIVPDDLPLVDGAGDDLAALAALAEGPQPRESLHVAIHQRFPVTKPSPRGDIRLAYFFWEESRVPADIVETLDHYDGVLVPADFVGAALSASGLRKPTVDIGYAPDLDPFLSLYDSRKLRLDEQRPFTFLHVSFCFPRKGVDVLLEAYARAFNAGDFVRLVIKGPTPSALPLIEAARSAHPGMAQVILVGETLDREALLELYRTADVMVLPARGEGFNVPAAEAIAAGLGLIVTGYGGQMQFCHGGAARLIDYRLEPSASHYGLADSVWAEPDVDDLTAAMLDAAAGRVGLDEDARAAALKILDRKAWMRRLDDAVNGLRFARPGFV